MEAATRPALEPLSDLPVEQALDTGGIAAAVQAKPDAREELINPDELLSAGSGAPAGPGPAPAPHSELTPPESDVQDLALLALDELPPLEALHPAAPPRRSAAADPEPAPPADKPSARSSDHTKLRGALRLASKARPATTPGRSATGDPAPITTAANPGRPERAAARRLDPTPQVASVPGAPPASPVSVPAASSSPPVPVPAAVSGSPASASASVTTSANASSSAAAGGPAGTPMDRDFIARNQIVERYLSGRLPLKGASDFERFCREQPHYLDEIGLSDRVNAGLRLLEAGGKPEPWQEAPRPYWQKPQVPLILAGLVALLGIALAGVANQSAGRARQIEHLKTQASERPLDPATSTREIRLLPSREGASNNPAVMVGGGPAQLIDLKIDESRSPYKVYRVTIDRIDQGRVAILGNLLKDSNGHLRIALNSSALGPGNYQFTIEGLTWRGEPEPDSWITLGVQH